MHDVTLCVHAACSAVRAFAACEEDDMRNLQVCSMLLGLPCIQHTILCGALKIPLNTPLYEHEYIESFKCSSRR